ncbi:MAG: copper homeostasis protein CutC [Gemmatimonadetes bacterium]|nr:copper homeostasis protein CutC [Gemmatimonadota bacterium]
MSILVEAAVETLDGAVQAERDGAGRLELCADLARDGTTPSAGLIREVRQRVDIPVHVIIRPRPGDFHYDAGELAVMLADIRECRRAGVDGVVIGALTAAGAVDREMTARLLAAARPLRVTFHRAADATPDLGATVALLAELGVDHVLTSGGAPTALEGAERLAGLERIFGRSIGILAGGSVRADRVAELVRRTGVRQVHVGFPWGAPADRIAGVVASLRG